MFASSRQALVPAARDRALAGLLGLHGLALLVVFPLGPQETRLWHPGVRGIATLAAAFPLAAVVGGLLARRIPSLPSAPRTLAALAFLGTLPCAWSAGYPTLVCARLFAGLATGLSFVAVHRVLPASAAPLVARIAPRVVAFGMPVCVLAATLLDWRAAFVPLLLGLALLGGLAPRTTAGPAPAPLPLAEAVPAALLATGALAFVTGAYLTVLSGYLVYNAGHTELHIPAGLLIGALLGLAVPAGLARLRAQLAPTAVYAVALAVSVLSLSGLLALRGPLPAALAVSLVGCFIAANAGRHLALARLVSPRLTDGETPAHQTHTHLAHHLGSGLGALCAGLLIHAVPGAGLAGMPALFACALAATGLALAGGLACAQADSAAPAAPAAAASTRLRVAASFFRSVRTSSTRSPGSPT